MAPPLKSPNQDSFSHKPFGTYAPNKREQKARNLAKKLTGKPTKKSDTRTATPRKIGKFIRSLLWRYASGNTKRPRDVTLFDGQKVRLHPYDNICEKRTFLTPQFWENQERAFLEDFIEKHKKTHKDKEFCFIDAGANVGLYTLFVRSCTQKRNLTLKALCIEPGLIVRGRLEFNILANEARGDISVSPYALSDTDTRVGFNVGHKNLGESRVENNLSTDDNQSTIINAQPLHKLTQMHQFKRIDALKIDIEGQEYKTLKAFFQHADKISWPRIVIIEIAHAQNHQDLIKLFNNHDYQPVHQHRGNMIFMLK